jgi:hypothetical protein
MPPLSHTLSLFGLLRPGAPSETSVGIPEVQLSVVVIPLAPINPNISRIVYCDHGYGRPSGRPRVSDPATYCLSTPRIQPPAVARWHSHLRGLATTIHKTSEFTRPNFLPSSGRVFYQLHNVDTELLPTLKPLVGLCINH